MLGSILAAGIMIYLMPTTCDPSHEWYQGTVVADIQPTFYPESGKFEIDLGQMTGNLGTYKDKGVGTVHLKNFTYNLEKVRRTFKMHILLHANGKS